MKLSKKTLNINGANRVFICNPEKDSLADVLRRIGLTSVKVGCGTGVCGSCSVVLNGEVVRSCTPGFVVSSYALMQKNNNPTREEVRDWFQKHKDVCSCIGYKQIVDAVMDAAKVMRGEATIEDITYKLPEDKEYYGKPIVRPTALAKVCGLADYGDDQEMKMPENAYHIVMVQPRVAHHAKIILADDIKAAGGSNMMAEGQFHERSTVMVPKIKGD